eukprot:CAMPEP_0197031820 /NCGR_PEP_ID=MMETSP1384-20130603/10686_1 /TAXON_ID=29189 /ORGANISM="Ammonia sp." /LENGTH=897 /DNA_ID=CAMNT_0042461395 /DNA_START=26 /DNA_END=2719 /DNA_ORIENTATION=+
MASSHRRKNMSLQIGDVVVVKDKFVGIIRYIGWVNYLSNGRKDEYIGIELKYRPDSDDEDVGIHTDGNHCDFEYFKPTLSSPAKGRFIKQHDITKKFNAEQLCDLIIKTDKSVLLSGHPPPPKPVEPKIKAKPEPVPLQQPESKVKPKQPPARSPAKPAAAAQAIAKVDKPESVKPLAASSNANQADTDLQPSGDLAIIAKRLNSFLTPAQLKLLIEFCKQEALDSLDNFEDDLDEESIENSGIVVEMRMRCQWDDEKVRQFVDLALNRPARSSSTPHGPTTEPTSPASPPRRDRFGGRTRQHSNAHVQKPQEEKVAVDDVKQPAAAEEDDHVIPGTGTYQYQLPLITSFVVPREIMLQRKPRSILDIVQCMKQNQIPKEAISRFNKFCNKHGYKFADLQNNLSEIRETFKAEHADLIVFIDYIEKCIYELAPPLFKGCHFDKSDEKAKHRYFEKQCKGIIKHDGDLLQYFCITEHTEKELPSQLIDIADRMFVEERKPLNVEHFSRKYFFQHLNGEQVKLVKEGFRKYHNRFLPTFPKKALKMVADKMSAYQNYCCLLSQIVVELNRQIASGYNAYNKKNELLVPYMIDMMILPPGAANKVEDQNKRPYDMTGPFRIGEVEKRFKDFDIAYETTRGLGMNNFDDMLMQKMKKRIVDHIKKITQNFTRTHQRICILIDRRWRLKDEKFDASKKLRQFYSEVSANDDDGDDDIFDGAEGFTPKETKKSWFGGGGKSTTSSAPWDKHAFYRAKADTIYVYQTNLKKRSNASYHEFNEQYCHETLIYLTKQCIIPRNDHWMHIGGDTTDGWLFNISAHVQIPKNQTWYNYEQRWYLFLQSAALRFFPQDMVNGLWSKFFIDADEDAQKLNMEQIKKSFAIDLEESDSVYKRWYYAIKRSD